MKARFAYLSPGAQRRLHEASLEILERIGVWLHEPEAVALLRKAGAKIGEDNRVHLPPKRVEWALSTAPKSIILYDREGRPALPLQKGRVYYGPGSDCPFIIDHRTGERRQATLNDVREAARLGDALPNIDFLMSACLPSDVEPQRANRLQMRIMLESSAKPILFVTNDFPSCRDAVRAAEEAAGGAAELAARPFCGCYINVSSPLRHNEDSLQKLLFLAAKGLPTTYTPVVLRGASGPVTGAGATALANAGELVGLVLAQLAREGAPIIHSGGFSDAFDMRTLVGVYAGPESYGARSSLAAFYGLPSFGLGGASDSKLPDEQAACEAALGLLLESLAGINLVHDLGYLESGKCFSLQLLVLCDELAGWIRKYLRGVEVNEETLALDLIAERGPDGDYLGSEHTLRHFREGWQPVLFDRRTFEGWVQAGRKTLIERSRERIDELLSAQQAPALSPGIRQKIEQILY